MLNRAKKKEISVLGMRLTMKGKVSFYILNYISESFTSVQLSRFVPKIILVTISQINQLVTDDVSGIQDILGLH